MECYLDDEHTGSREEREKNYTLFASVLLRVLNVCFVCVIWDRDCSSVNKILHFMYE